METGTQLLILTPLLLVGEILYLRVAQQYAIVDLPGQRRSHRVQTVRGGGVIFLAAGIWAGVAGLIAWPAAAGLVLCGVLGLVEDILRIRPFFRLLWQAVSLGLLLYALEFSGLSPWFGALILFLGLAWINAFNFMDGINGMLVLYTLVSLMTFWYFPGLEAQRGGILVMGAGVVVFAFFNVRHRALAFSGDVGSLTLAFYLCVLMVEAILRSGQIGCLLFFVVYGIDTAVTIAVRLLRKENIFRAHRSHLYQLLANECGMPHLVVASLYAGVQFLVNLLAFQHLVKGSLSFIEFLGIVSLLGIVYLVLRNRVSTGKEVQ